VLITNTVIEGNGNIGVRVEDRSIVTMRDSVLQGNGTEGFNAVSWGGRMANTRIWKNTGSGIATAGAGQVLSQGNNTNQANGANGAPTGAFGLQ